MIILGISCYYHDSSAALLKDGKVVAAAAEERFTRKKHDTSFPINAANYCLESQGITIDDVDLVGFYEKPFIKFERILFQHIEMFPRSFKTFLSSMPSWLNEKLRVIKGIKKKLKYKKPFHRRNPDPRKLPDCPVLREWLKPSVNIAGTSPNWPETTISIRFSAGTVRFRKSWMSWLGGRKTIRYWWVSRGSGKRPLYTDWLTGS